MELIRLPLKGTANTRDIGGYVGENNRGFKWKKILRSDCLSTLKEEDKDYLVDKYKLGKVIDLRSLGEVEKAPSLLNSDSRVKYINIPLSGDIDPNKPNYFSSISERFLQEIYIDIIENKQEGLKKVIEEIIDVNDSEAVLFNCTAGKDRTGVLTMLLHGICGVSKQDITTNYLQTEVNLKYSSLLSELNKKASEKFSLEIAKRVMNSNPENIEEMYDLIIDKYKSFYDYFLLIGISKENIEKLVNSLTVELD